MRIMISLWHNGAEHHTYRQQIIEHLDTKVPRTDPQKMEVQQRRNGLARRIKLWRTAQVVYMPQVSRRLPDEQDLATPDDPYEFDELKPELWPLFLPSQLSQDNWSSSHQGVTETEQILRLAQVKDALIDLRRLRRSLRSHRMYFRSNVIGEGRKAQTKSRASESSVTTRINRTVRRYRLAYSALLSLDPTGEWRKEYLDLTDKDNRGPGKELDEVGVGDGHYAMSWIWRGYAWSEESDLSDQEVNETVRHEWMTCRARADRWREEMELLQEEMRRVVVFLEWKSSSWTGRVGARLGSVAVDVQHGIDAYARKQANTYHELAVSLANQWLPHLLKWKLDVSWTKDFPWAGGITHPQDSSDVQGNPPTDEPEAAETARGIEPADLNNDSDDESDDGYRLGATGGIHDEGEDSDGLVMGFEYDDDYMA